MMNLNQILVSISSSKGPLLGWPSSSFTLWTVFQVICKTFIFIMYTFSCIHFFSAQASCNLFITEEREVPETWDNALCH